MDQNSLYWFEKMLLNVGKITDKYNYNKEITGEDFNLFQIIRYGHEEVPVHSAFLAELLNVNSKHKMGDVFQKLFIEDIVSKVVTLDLENIKNLDVSKEVIIDTESRIDICLENSEYCFVIENKIYAQDQDKQLLRYFKYVKKKDITKRHVFYLNLFGTEPSEQSVEGMEETDYEVISYKHHINPWLEKCLIKAVKKPYVRENISQYLDLLRKLTNSVEATVMNQIKESILNEINLEALKNLPAFIDTVEKMQNEYALKFFNELYKKYLDLGWIAEQNKTSFINISDVKNTKKWERRGYIKIKLSSDFEIWSSFSSAEDGNCKYSWFQSHLRLEQIKDPIMKNKIIDLLMCAEFKEIGMISKDNISFHIDHQKIDILNYYDWYDEKKRVELVNEIAGKVKKFVDLFESKIES